MATVLVMIQPTAMLVIGSYGYDDDFTPCPTEADPNPETVNSHSGMGNFFFDGDDNTEALVPNTVVGWMIQVFGTYLGFILMFWGVIWATNLDVKIKKKWAALRFAK
jgi:hypothetical protein